MAVALCIVDSCCCKCHVSKCRSDCSCCVLYCCDCVSALSPVVQKCNVAVKAELKAPMWRHQGQRAKWRDECHLARVNEEDRMLGFAGNRKLVGFAGNRKLGFAGNRKLGFAGFRKICVHVYCLLVVEHLSSRRPLYCWQHVSLVIWPINSNVLEVVIFTVCIQVRGCESRRWMSGRELTLLFAVNK